MNEEIIFYTTHCPKCSVLKKKMDAKNIKYKCEDNVQNMLALGIKQAPMLGINGKIYNFVEAVRIINEYSEENNEKHN